MKTPIETPTAPAWMRAGLMLLLPVIALAVYWDGQRYDSDLLDLKREGGFSAGLFPEGLGELARFGPLRHYTADNLYEYINGHAEFFLSAGFQSLAVGEYAPAGADAPAVTVNLFDMGKALHAFGVLMDEGANGEAVDIGSMGFAGGQGVNFIDGPYYVQLSVFDNAMPVVDAARGIADTLAGQARDDAFVFRFPALGTVTGTRFIKEDYRGLEFLDNVLERTFERDGDTLAVFLVSGGTEKITALVTAFTEFFNADGIDYRREEHAGQPFYRVMDPYEGEWFFVAQENRLLGVYAAPEAALLEAIGTHVRTSS